LRAGSAEFVVTQPRMPCFKLGIRFGRADMVKRFQRSGRTGFYLAVLREGEVAAGDPVEFIARDEHGVIPSPVENRLVSRTRGAGDCVSRHGSAGTGYLSTRRAFQRVLV